MKYKIKCGMKVLAVLLLTVSSGSVTTAINIENLNRLAEMCEDKLGENFLFKLRHPFINKETFIESIYSMDRHLSVYTAWLNSLSENELKEILAEKNEYGRTPLHLAVEENNIELLKLLLDKGANIDTEDYYGTTALDYAVEDMNENMIALLLGKGIDINYANNSGNNILHLAVYRFKDNIIETLVARHVDINARNQMGETPLHIAIKSNNLYAVISLINKDADVNIRDNNGETPLDVASKNNYVDMLNYIRTGTTRDQCSDEDKLKLLFKAINKNHMGRVRILLNNNVDPNDVNNGWPALCIASFFA